MRDRVALLLVDATLFVFLAAATGAWIVSAWTFVVLFNGFDWRRKWILVFSRQVLLGSLFLILLAFVMLTEFIVTF